MRELDRSFGSLRLFYRAPKLMPQLRKCVRQFTQRTLVGFRFSQE